MELNYHFIMPESTPNRSQSARFESTALYQERRIALLSRPILSWKIALSHSPYAMATGSESILAHFCPSLTQ